MVWSASPTTMNIKLNHLSPLKWTMNRFQNGLKSSLKIKIGLNLIKLALKRLKLSIKVKKLHEIILVLFYFRDKSKYTLSPGKQNASVSKMPAEPNVDFEFHVKIFINSGKCVLHTSKEEERRKMKKDRSFSGPFGHSPNSTRKLNKNDTLRSSHMSSSR